MRRCSLAHYSVINLKLLFILTLIIFAKRGISADFKINLQIRYDNGREVNPGSTHQFPDNQINRRFFEKIYTAERLFTQLPLGDQLRLGFRWLELQPSDVDAQLYHFEDEHRLDDKIYAQLKLKRWEFWLGDVYETFGRGLTFNLFENRDLYFDSGLRGGKVTYRTGKLRFKTIYGQSRRWYLVEKERLGGVNLEYKPSPGYNIGGNLVFQDGLNYDRRFMPGIYGGFEIGPVSLYYEYAQSRLDNDSTSTVFHLTDILSNGSSKQGDGTFIGLDVYLMGVSAQFNYKYYKFGVDNPFQTPPIVQREYTTHLMSSHPHLPLIDDQLGFEIDLSASPLDQVILNLNFSRASRHVGRKLIPSLNEDFSPFWELFIEGELYPSDKWTLKLGTGWNEEARSNFWQEKVGVFSEAIYSINNYWSFTLTDEIMWVDDRIEDERFKDYYLSASVARAPYGSMNLSYEASSLDSDVEGDRWLGAELAVNITGEHRILLFGGRERGGLKCTSGVCRPVQPFEGFRITYDGRF